MKKSLRARRMARNHRRMQKVATLNLVPVIDIFTMLLFFLMVNTGGVELIDSDKTIRLPESISEQAPEEALLIKVNGEDIIVQERKVARVAAVLASDQDIVPALTRELQLWAGRKLQLTDAEKERGRAVTIMGDQQIPYKLLKRVMATCAQADYRDISLAVAALPEDPPAGAPVKPAGAGV
jgi:biopolymer transport protein TolR